MWRSCVSSDHTSQHSDRGISRVVCKCPDGRCSQFSVTLHKNKAESSYPPVSYTFFLPSQPILFLFFFLITKNSSGSCAGWFLSELPVLFPSWRLLLWGPDAKTQPQGVGIHLPSGKGSDLFCGDLLLTATSLCYCSESIWPRQVATF